MKLRMFSKQETGGRRQNVTPFSTNNVHVFKYSDLNYGSL